MTAVVEVIVAAAEEVEPQNWRVERKGAVEVAVAAMVAKAGADCIERTDQMDNTLKQVGLSQGQAEGPWKAEEEVGRNYQVVAAEADTDTAAAAVAEEEFATKIQNPNVDNSNSTAFGNNPNSEHTDSPELAAAAAVATPDVAAGSDLLAPSAVVAEGQKLTEMVEEMACTTPLTHLLFHYNSKILLLYSETLGYIKHRTFEIYNSRVFRFMHCIQVHL